MMGLGLSAADVSGLEARTEGWIAGLQLAALSIRGRSDVGGFIAGFTGSQPHQEPYTAIMAAGTVVTVPLVILVLVLQRRIVAGLTAGGVKG